MRFSKTKLNLKALGVDAMACWRDGGNDQTGHEVALARIYGVATGLKAVESQYSDEPQNCILGSFDGVNLQTGEMIERAGKLFLPDVGRSYIEALLREGGAAKFDITILASRLRKQDGSLSFTYACESMGADAIDPLAEMREQVRAEIEAPKPVKQIEAPKSKRTAKLAA